MSSVISIDIEDELLEIVNFIIVRIDGVASGVMNTTEKKALLINLERFLKRLINDPANVDNFEIVKKGNRQLLCSIGIDLKSGTVPDKEYLDIFLEIDFKDNDSYAKKLFFEKARHKHFTASKREPVPDFRMMVCPIKDWKYYIEEPPSSGLFGKEQRTFKKEEIVNSIQKGSKKIWVKNNLLRKSYYWLSTDDDYKNTLSSTSSHSCITNKLVDALGLSHFDYTNEWTTSFFYINFGDIEIETFKPNATIIDWAFDKVGFLSMTGESGETCSVTGSGLKGLKEKVFYERTLTTAEVENTSIGMLSDEVTPPIIINCESIVIEGINRFKNIIL